MSSHSRTTRSRRGPAAESVLAAVVAGGAIGTILVVILVAIASPTAVGPIAEVAIITIGSTAGSAIGVLAVAVHRTSSNRH